MTRALTMAPFRRVYFDVPSDVYDVMVTNARAAGMTQKDYLAKLVTDDAARKSKSRKG